MREQIRTLVELQKVESEIADIRRVLAKLPEALRQVETRRETMESELAAQSALVEHLVRTYRTMEADAKAIQEQVAKSQVKLMAVKTNKEYTSSLKEIGDLKAKISAIEDEMLTCLDQTEAMEKRLADQRADHRELTLELGQQREAIELEARQYEERLTRLLVEAKAVAEKVDTHVLAIFNTVRGKQARGVAIVAVVDALCQGCNVNIPPQLYNELQRCDKIQFCPICQRIIYWEHC